MSKKNNNSTTVFVLYDFIGTSNNLLSVKEGDFLTVDYNNDKFKEWWLAFDSKGNKGFVPRCCCQDNLSINFHKIASRIYPCGLGEFITKILLNIDSITQSDAILCLETLSSFTRAALDINFIKELPISHLFINPDIILFSTLVFIKLETEMMTKDNNHRVDDRIYNQIVSTLVVVNSPPMDFIIGIITNYLDEANKFLDRNQMAMNYVTFLGLYMTMTSVLLDQNSSSSKTYTSKLFSYYKITKIFEAGHDATTLLIKQFTKLPPKLQSSFVVSWFQEFSLLQPDHTGDIKIYQEIFIVLLEHLDDAGSFDQKIGNLITEIFFEHITYEFLSTQSLYFKFKLIPIAIKYLNYRGISLEKLIYYSILKIDPVEIEKCLNSLSNETKEKLLADTYSFAITTSNIDNTVIHWDNSFVKYFPQYDFIGKVCDIKGNLPSMVLYIKKLSTYNSNTTLSIMKYLIQNRCISLASIVELSIRLPGFQQYTRNEHEITTIANRSKKNFPFTAFQLIFNELPNLANDLLNMNMYPEFNLILSIMEPSEQKSVIDLCKNSLKSK